MCVCVLYRSFKNQKKKKNLVQLYEYSNSNLLHRIVQRSINSKKNDWEKKRNYYTSPPLSISSLRPH